MKTIMDGVLSRWVWLVLLVTVPWLTANAANDDVFDVERALAMSRNAVGKPLEDYSFLDRHEQAVRLASFKGKPLVISFVYTSCFQTCSTVTRSLADMVEKAREALGVDSFTVVTIGFDTRVDNPKAMAWFADHQGVKDEHWHFLSGDAHTVERLTRNVGFSYVRSPKGFDHMTQATVVNADGVIHQQVYGEIIQLPWLVDPLKELILGTPRREDSVMEDLVRRVRLFCTTYDPNQNAYRFDYSLFVGLFIGASIILGTAIWLFREVRRTLRS
ncbi:MAG: SCO family protein [Magnetococcales bacterium]|nr:SCO family protein [Magnetococcales bacterium]